MRLRINWLISGLLFLAVLCLSTSGVAADDSTAVGLRYFRAFSLDNSVRLEWETATEQETAAFKLLRASAAEGPFEFLADIGLIEAIGNTQAGATYERIDETAENGNTYWYRLVEIETDNTEVDLATIEHYLEPPSGGINPPGGGDQPPPATTVPTSTDEPTQTSVPTDTPTASETPTPTETATAEPTETEVPATATVTPRPLGPTPTAFRFATATPAAVAPEVIGGGVPVAEAAGIPAQEQYPGATSSPGVIQATSYPAGTPFPGNPATVPPGGSGSDLDNGTLNALPTATGIAGAIGQEGSENQASSRVFLWLGFAGGLLILSGGVFFSIFLATRRK